MIDLTNSVAIAQLATAILFLAVAIFINAFGKFERQAKSDSDKNK